MSRGCAIVFHSRTHSSFSPAVDHLWKLCKSQRGTRELILI